MKYLITIWCVLASHILLAQAPNGRLYVFTGTGGVSSPELGYIQYPAGTYHVINTIQVNDVAILNDKLVVAALGAVVIYDTVNYQQVDILHGIIAERIAAWGDQLVITSVAEPHFQVVDLQSHNQIYSLDTFQLNSIPGEIEVSGDMVYLLLGSSVGVVDLQLPDSMLQINTPHPFGFAGFNADIISKGDDLYIDVEYITGALRFSMLRMNKSTLAVDTIFHKEGLANFAPMVLAENRIYLMSYDSYYDINQDTLWVSTSPFWPQAVEYDSVSGAFFLNHNGNGVSFVVNGQYADTVILNGNLRKALFVQAGDTTTGIGDEPITDRMNCQVFPNPADDHVTIRLASGTPIEYFITLYRMSGQEMIRKNGFATVLHEELDVSDLPKGVYILILQSEEGVLVKKLAIH